MDINKLNLDQTQTVQNLKEFFGASGKVKDKQNSDDPVADLDSFGSSFAILKKDVSHAQEPGRAEYVKAIKAMIDAGTYNVGSSELADAMIADGYAEELAV